MMRTDKEGSMLSRPMLPILATCLALCPTGCGGTLVPMDDQMAYAQPATQPVAQPPALPSSPAPYKPGTYRDPKADLLAGSANPGPGAPGPSKEDMLGPAPSTYPVPTDPNPLPVMNTPETAACKGWLSSWMGTADPSLLNKGAKLDVLWREPVKKPAQIFPSVLPPIAQSDVEWLSMKADQGTELLNCTAHVQIVHPCGNCPDASMRTVLVYARYDLVPGKDGPVATRLSFILELDDDMGSGKIFDRLVGDCGILTEASVPPKTLCGLLTIDDEPVGGPGSGMYIYRDIAEVLVFDTSGHLDDYLELGVVKGSDTNPDVPMGVIDPSQTVDLHLGSDVLIVYEEKVKPLGGGHPSSYGYDDCAAYGITGSGSYYLYDGKSLVKIFSSEVDVFTDAPCASDYQIDSYKDLVVDIETVCNGPGPCELHLHYDQVTPIDKVWHEVWKFDGKKYVKAK
jgi:hypothetical protein